MSFRLVPKSVTLNDFEQRNGRYFALFHRIRLAFGAHCVKVKNVKVKKRKGSLFVYRLSYSSLGAQVWHVLKRDHTVLPATHTFYPQVK